LLTVLIGMVIAILLLPRIQKFKVGTLELEKAQSPDVSVVLRKSSIPSYK
jgi:hypothetical protein